VSCNDELNQATQNGMPMSLTFILPIP